MRTRKDIKGFLPLVLIMFGVLFTACHHHDDPDPVPEERVAQQTILMYMPWAGGGSIYNACLKNITAMKTAIEYRGGLGQKRVVVFIASTANRAYLIDLKYENGSCKNDTLKTYTTLSGNNYTTASGLTALFSDVITSAKANSYGMVVSAHGMGWLPAGESAGLAKGAAAWPMDDSAASSQQSASPRYAPKSPVGVYRVDRDIETRFIGTPVGVKTSYQTDITVFGDAVQTTFRHLDFLLFDDCHMQNIEVAYALKDITDYIIGSTSEVMMVGLPYTTVGGHLLDADYVAVVKDFYDFFIDYKDPYGTLSVVKTSEVQALADLMKQANTHQGGSTVDINDVQYLDGFAPTIFFDMGSYINRLCADDDALRLQLQTQLSRVVVAAAHTPMFYSVVNKSEMIIREFSGITISDPSTAVAARSKTQTLWWQATH